MEKVEITGYKKIVKNGKTLFYLSALAKDPIKGVEGLATFNAFVSLEHLKKHNVPLDSSTGLIGLECYYYSCKDGDTYRSGITFKNYSERSCM